MKRERPTCFAIMPFGGWFDQYWEQIYRPAIEAAKLRPRRADDVFRSGSIMSDIWRYTRLSDVILSDLTGRNGNVLYELGLAHAIGKPTLLVSESIDDVPFDLRGLRVLLYDRKEPDWGVRLGNAIIDGLRQTLSEPSAAIPSTFVEERPNTEQPALSTNARELLQLRQDVELLKRQLVPAKKPRVDPITPPLLPSWGSMLPTVPAAGYGDVTFEPPSASTASDEAEDSDERH